MRLVKAYVELRTGPRSKLAQLLLEIPSFTSLEEFNCLLRPKLSLFKGVQFDRVVFCRCRTRQAYEDAAELTDELFGQLLDASSSDLHMIVNGKSQFSIQQLRELNHRLIKRVNVEQQKLPKYQFVEPKVPAGTPAIEFQEIDVKDGMIHINAECNNEMLTKLQRHSFLHIDIIQ